MYVLLGKLRHVFAAGDTTRYLVPDEALTSFMAHCANRVGDAYFRTPRTTIKEFVNLLAVLDQNPDVAWSDLIQRVEIGPEQNPDLTPLAEDVGVGRGDAGEEMRPLDDDLLPRQRVTMTSSRLSDSSPGLGVF